MYKLTGHIEVFDRDFSRLILYIVLMLFALYHPFDFILHYRNIILIYDPMAKRNNSSIRFFGNPLMNDVDFNTQRIPNENRPQNLYANPQ